MGGFLGFNLSPYFSSLPPFFTFHSIKHLDVEEKEQYSKTIHINMIMEDHNGSSCMQGVIKILLLCEQLNTGKMH